MTFAIDHCVETYVENVYYGINDDTENTSAVIVTVTNVLGDYLVVHRTNYTRRKICKTCLLQLMICQDLLIILTAGYNEGTYTD